MLSLVSILVAFISYCFSSLKNLAFGCSIEAWQHLNKCSIAAQYKPLLSRISGFFSIPLDRYLDPSSLFPEVFVCLIKARHLLDLSKMFCRWFLLDISQSIELLFSTPHRYLLNLLRCLFLYILEVRPGSVFSQTFRSFSPFSQYKPYLFIKNLLPFIVLASSKLESFGKWTKSLLFFIFHAFYAF